MVTVSLPSLGVLSNNETKVFPPSLEIFMLTLAVLTGAAVVLATSQVTAKLFPEVKDCPNVGAVTLNGPALALTVTNIASCAILGSKGLLFLKTTPKLSALETLETDSQRVVFTPARTVLKSGKYLYGLLVGGTALKFGPEGFAK